MKNPARLFIGFLCLSLLCACFSYTDRAFFIAASAQETVKQSEGDAGMSKILNPEALNFEDWERLDELAARVYEDLIANFWVDDAQGGHILHTWTGYDVATIQGGDSRGGIWERGMMFIALDTYYRATGDERALEKMRLESEHFATLYSEREMAAAGSGLHWACDDCGWHAWFYMKMYRYFMNELYLNRAEALINNAARLWLDDELGGGMWYTSERQLKSLYTVGVAMACLDIYEHTGNEEMYGLAVELYEWMESALLRDDGIYWMDLKPDGPFGKERPNDINEAGSVTGLGGNMAMAAIHARMYRLTGLDVYRGRALRTMEGVKNKLVRNGMLLNDRDAWTNTTFLMEWTQEVLTLPGMDMEYARILLDTALCVADNARTEDGYYSAVWQGPPMDMSKRWNYIGSLPQQIMTTSTTANLILCAALYKNTYFGAVRP